LEDNFCIDVLIFIQKRFSLCGSKTNKPNLLIDKLTTAWITECMGMNE